MSSKLFINILWCRKWLVLFVLVATIGTTAYMTFRMAKVYSAYATLVLNAQESGPFEQTGIQRIYTSGYLRTQADIIASRRVALKSLDLIKEESLRTLAIQAVGSDTAPDASEPGIRDRVATLLLKDLAVSFSNDSRVVNVSIQSSSPNLSAEIANAFAQAYIDTTLELIVDPAKRNAAWFDEQIATFRTRLEEKQRALTAYQAGRGIVSIDERLDTEMRRFEELSSALVTAQAETFNVRSRQLGPQHPEYIRVLQQERSVEESLDQQKTRVLEARQLRDELQLLSRDVDTARNTYDIALQGFYQNTLESQFNQTNIAILNKAEVPGSPSSPNMRLNVALAALLGLAFGCGLALVVELSMRKVRIEEDLTDALGLRVLASL